MTSISPPLLLIILSDRWLLVPENEILGEQATDIRSMVTTKIFLGGMKNSLRLWS
jgi:hypothetical protein